MKSVNFQNLLNKAKERIEVSTQKTVELIKKVESIYLDPRFEKSLDEAIINLGMLNWKSYKDKEELREELHKKFGDEETSPQKLRLKKKLEHYFDQYAKAVASGAILGAEVGVFIGAPEQGAIVGACLSVLLCSGTTIHVLNRNFRARSVVLSPA